MADKLTGTLEAAALHGIAINPGYVITTQLAAARQALDIYERETERARPLLEAALAWRDGIKAIGATGAEAAANAEQRTKNRWALEQAADVYANGGAS